MDLHAWITQQVDAVEQEAHAATPGPWTVGDRKEADWGPHGRQEPGTVMASQDEGIHAYGVPEMDNVPGVQTWPQIVVTGYRVSASGASVADALARRENAAYLARHDPATALRRCEADRRILARHCVDPTRAHHPVDATACHGCGTYGDCDYPATENINDCPELLDLAHAHGLTDEILAGLDRPQPPEPKRRDGVLGLADILATPPITTSDVPEALRGPHWKP